MSDGTHTRPRRRWLLFVSLFLNFFLVGVIVAGTWVNWQRRALGEAPGASPMNPMAIARALDGESRDKVEAIIADNRRAFWSLLRDVRRSRLEAYRMLDDETLDRAEFERSLADIRAADEALAKATGTLVVDILQQLTLEERRALKERIRRRGWDRRLEEPLDDAPEAPPE